MQTPARLLPLLALSVLMTACTTPRSETPQDSTKYAVERTEKFELLDMQTQNAVSCTGIQERLLPDGRIEVVANLKNREQHALALQVQCLFKTEHNLPVETLSPWQEVEVAAGATETVRFSANKAEVRNYTLRVRQAR